MSKKSSFITEIDDAINEGKIELSEDAMAYFEAMKDTKDSEAKLFTTNGAMVLKYMQENKDTYNNLFKAKDMGEALGVSSRTVSGACRKLVTDGYVEKEAGTPTMYSITELGMSMNVDEN